jgi:hypothetical protein
MTDRDPGERALEGPVSPPTLEPIALRTEWQPFVPRWDVIVSGEGIAWQRKGSEAGHWAPWPLIGGVSNGIAREHTPAASILALDGSSFGSIEGLLLFEGEKTDLAHVVALYRPDLFVEVEGYPFTGGCIRREIASAEADDGGTGSR